MLEKGLTHEIDHGKLVQLIIVFKIYKYHSLNAVSGLVMLSKLEFENSMKIKIQTFFKDHF